MSGAVILALIALAGTILQVVLTVWWPGVLQARGAARQRLDTYREPLVNAAYELQARLHNILKNRFIEDFLLDEQKAGKQDAAMQTTLYVFAQFLAWKEIIRRDVQFLRMRSDVETRDVQKLLGDITETFLLKELGHQFMIWRIEQHGLGGAMIDTDAGRPVCIGYGEFLAKRDAMAMWLDPLNRDLRDIQDSGRARLTLLQHQLLALVILLDPEKIRVPFVLDKA